MAKKKLIRDLKLGEIVERCHKRKDCTSCPLVSCCGNVLGSYPNKILNVEADKL